jgi:2'-5' RNA ligase
VEILERAHTTHSAVKTRRLFVAVPLWDGFHETAKPVWSPLRKLDLGVRWVKPDHWHLTLKFLGPVPEYGIPEIERHVAERLANSAPFPFVLGGLGGFPRLSKMRVLWVGVREGDRALIDLAHAVHLGCVMAGFPGDKKPFQPHLTLARSKGEAVQVAVPKDLYEATWGTHQVDSVSLVESVLTPEGPTYKTLVQIPLVA